MYAPQLFLSYNSSDRDVVRQVQQLLQARGITTFLDFDNLVAGLPWPDALEQGLREVRAVAVFIGRKLGGWQKKEMGFALDQQVREEKQGRPFPVIPVLLPGADLTPGFLFLNTWVDLRNVLRGGLDVAGSAEAFDAFERAIRATAPAPPAERAEAISPYRGLQAFREEDAAFFIGREAFSRHLLEFTLANELVAVVGPSGSGKSSVVQAGLVPLLRRERPPTRTWDAVSFTPGRDPFHRLASALIPLLEPELTETDRLTEAEKLGNRLRSGDARLEAVIDRVIEKSNGTGRLLVVADQFEELFTVAPESDLRPFALALLGALGNAPFTLLVTLRADFYSQTIGLDRKLSDRIPSAQVNIGALTRDELRESITGPAKLVGLDLEPGLGERILADAGSEPGNLPLVEFALTELWQRREGRLLTNKAYDEIKGVTGALALRAEDEFARFTSEEQRVARRLFSRLVRVAKPEEAGEDTRQRIELEAGDAVTEKVAQTLSSGGVRLLVSSWDEQTGRKTVEVAHEALIRNWERLRGWVNEDREFLLWRQRLQVALEGYERSHADLGSLLRGTPLAEAEHWQATRPQDLTDAERGFVGESVALRDGEREKEEQRRQAELERALALAESERRRAEEQVRLADLERQLAMQANLLAEERKRRAEEAGEFFRTQELVASNKVGIFSAVTVTSTAAPFNWTDSAYKTPELDDLVVYELHVKDFNDTFDGVVDRLTYLQSLGVNCLELMPVMSTKVDFDWGFGPLHYFAPHPSFGGPGGLKKLVNACHAVGIAVILDVVYTRVDSFFAYNLVYNDVNGTAGAPKVASPMIGANGPFGPEADFSQAFTQEYFLTSNQMWLDEYHVDGFRYDDVIDFYFGATDDAYVKLVYDTYQYSLNIARFQRGVGSYSRIIQCAEALSKARDVLQNTYTNCAWQDDLLNKAENMMMVGNYADADFAHLLDPSFGGNPYPGTKTVNNAAGQPVDMPVAPFQYLETHDHSQLIVFGGTQGDGLIPPDDRSRFYKLRPFAIALYTLQGVPMLWQGQEFADNYNLPSSGAWRVGLRRNTHWEYFHDEYGASLVRLYHRLGWLRRTHRALRSRETYYYEQSLQGNSIIAYHRHAPGTATDPEEYVMVLLNFSDLPGAISVPFPKAGTWKEMIDNDVVTLTLTVANDGDTELLAAVPPNYGWAFVWSA